MEAIRYLGLVCKDCLGMTFYIQLYAILFILWRYNNLTLKGLTLSERIARRPAACIAAINYETDYIETNVDTSHKPRRDGKGGRGRKGLCNLHVARAIGGEVEMRKVGRDVYYWFMNCGVLALLCNVFLGNLFSDMIRIVKYRYLFAGSKLQFMMLKSSNGTNHSTFIARK